MHSNKHANRDRYEGGRNSIENGGGEKEKREREEDIEYS